MSACRVLVADDDRDLRDLLLDALAEAGYDARAARHGREALDLLEGGGWVPHVILLDLLMPEMDGWAFRAAQAARRAAPPIPLAVLTAAPDPERWAGVLGAAATLRKPFDLDALLRAVAGAAERGARR